MNISIVVPILNEEKIIKESLEAISKTAKKMVTAMEILAVNDGSTDKTASILSELHNKNPIIKIIDHKKNKGYGAALRSGIEKAQYEWIFFIDADMQFNIEELDTFLPYTKSYDFIVGYRKNRADSVRRIFISSIYNRIVKLIFGLPLRDVDCAFKLMRKTAIQQIPFKSDSFFVSSEVMVHSVRQKMRIKELPVNHLPRTKGKSTVTTKQILKTIKDLFKLYLNL